MADQTEIAWCDSTFNPWIGCEKISPGCDNCYAAAQDKFRNWTPEGWGGPRKRTSPAAWHAPVAWNAKHRHFYECLDCGRRFATPTKGLPEGWVTCPGCSPYKGKFADSEEGGSRIKEVRRRVFCASLADVFDNQVPREWRVDLFRLIRETPHLDWLLLTKRIGNVHALMDPVRAALCPADPMLLPPNVWLGATVVNQEEADRDIPKLLRVPASVRFLSCEPLLGPLQLWRLKTLDFQEDSQGAEVYPLRGMYAVPDCDWPGPKLDWVIAGGESGPGARPLQLQWVRDIVRQCRAASVPVLVKQLGREVLDDGMSSPGEHWPTGRVREPIPCRTDDDPGFVVQLQDRKGGDWSEWPEDLRVREFPEVRHA